MNKLVVLTFPDQTKIDEAIGTLRKLRCERGGKLYASAVVAKNSEGEVSVQEITAEGHGRTRTGALIGALAGLLVGPATAAITAVGGTVIGNAEDLSADDEFVGFANGIADQITPGGAAIVADVAEDGVSGFEATMHGLGGTVLSY